MDRGDKSIYQQTKKSYYNKYFIELACLVFIGKQWYWGIIQLFCRFMDLAYGKVKQETILLVQWNVAS